MTYETIIVEKRGATAIVTINRPKVLNALNEQVISDLECAFYEIRDDESVRSVIVTGAGDRSFIAGADISQFGKLTPEAARAVAARGQALLLLIENLGKPTIAAIGGFALGGGNELAMACNVRIASEKARFGQPEINLGIIPGYGGTQRLARLVGQGRAIEICLSGDMIDAQEAYRIGLVNKVVPPERLLDAALEMAAKFNSKGAVAVRAIIEAVNHGLESSLALGLRLEAGLFGVILSTEDAREGSTAFLEKREARFKGR